MSKRLWSFGIVLAIFALLLGGCNFQRETGLANPPAGSLSVGIVKPGSDAYTNTGEIEVKVSATSGKVEDVQVSYEGPHKGIVSLTPSGGVWRGTLPESLPSGSYTLRARAKSGGLEGASPPVSFTLDREKPEVAILAPSSSILLSGPSLRVRARARDALSGIKTVTLFANATRLNVNSVQRGDEYTFGVDVSSLPEGVLALRVVAEDQAGNSQEAQVDVVVDRTAPTVAWKVPPEGSQVAGVRTLEVEALDNVGVAKVEFFAGSTKLGEVTAPPYLLSWDTIQYPNGPIFLKARALDLAGNASEANLQVTVANKSAFLITTPAEGDRVGPGANRAIVAVTIGNSGTLPADGEISRVDVYINGLFADTATSQTASDGSRIFVYIWDTRNAVGGHDPDASGDRVITARVFYADKDTWTNGVRVMYLP